MPTPPFVLALRERVGHDQLWLPGVTAVVLREHDARTQVLLVRRADTGEWTPVTGIAARADLTTGPEPYYEQLRRLFGVVVTDVEQRISAVAIPPDIAANLQTAAGGPALLVRRQYFAGRALIEVSLSIHPADRYAYTQRLSRARSETA